MIEEKIAELIRDLLTASADGDSEGVLRATLALDALKAENGPELKGHLGHFLEKRSYQKALAFIEAKQGK